METWLKKIILFLVSQTVTLSGSMVVSFAVMWYITIETSSGVMMTTAVLCIFLPQIFISPLAGVAADRYNRKKLIIVSDLAIAAVTLVMAILWSKGNDSYAFLFLVMALRSIGQGIQQPAVGALIPQIVPVEHLTRLNAIYTTILNALNLLTPALGGVLLAVGFVKALYFDVVTAVIGVTILSFLVVGKIEKAPDAATGSVFRELKEGLAFVKHTAWLRFMLIFYAVGFFLITPAAFLTPIFVERIFGPEIWRLTMNEILWAVGAIIGGVVIAAWGGFKNRIFSMGFSFLFFGITFAVMGLANNFWLYLAVLGAAGFFLPMFTTAETTLIQEKTAPQMMGRVFSLISIIISMVMPLGMLLFGPLADIINVRVIMAGSGLLMIIPAAYLLFNKRLLALDPTGRPGLK